MNTYKIQSNPGDKSISLYSVLEEMLGCYERVKKDRRNFFINEVPRNMSVCAGKNMLAKVLGELFAVITSNPGRNCVRISAKKSASDITLFIKNSEIRGFNLSGIRIQPASF